MVLRDHTDDISLRKLGLFATQVSSFRRSISTSSSCAAARVCPIGSCHAGTCAFPLRWTQARIKIWMNWRDLKRFKVFFGVQQKQRFVKKTSCLQERSSIEGRLQTFVYLVARFPPTIFYKIYTHGNVVDLGSFAPREYHLERLSQEQGNILPGSTIAGWGFQ